MEGDRCRYRRTLHHVRGVPWPGPARSVRQTNTAGNLRLPCPDSHFGPSAERSSDSFSDRSATVHPFANDRREPYSSQSSRLAQRISISNRKSRWHSDCETPVLHLHLQGRPARPAFDSRKRIEAQKEPSVSCRRNSSIWFTGNEGDGSRTVSAGALPPGWNGAIIHTATEAASWNPHFAANTCHSERRGPKIVILEIAQLRFPSGREVEESLLLLRSTSGGCCPSGICPRPRRPCALPKSPTPPATGRAAYRPRQKSPAPSSCSSRRWRYCCARPD
jgi:hypothetical protein